MLFEIHLALGVISVFLSFILVLLFFRVYRLQRSLYLLGMPIGFLFLTLSYFFLLMHFLYSNIAISASVMWIRVIAQTWGFTLIAASYYLSKRTKKITKFSIFDLSAWSVVSLICVFGLLIILNPVIVLNSVYVDNRLFTAANLVLLTYIFLFLLRNLESIKIMVKGMVFAPLVFALLWLGQFCFLIWDIDRSSVALLGSQVAPVIGLTIFLLLYYFVGKEPKMIGG